MRLSAGMPWKAALEELLLELPEEASERLQQVLRESRGAWIALLAGGGGRALFLGDPLSGTVIALARAGYRVAVVARDATRLALLAARAAADAEERVDALLADDLWLPFRPATFDLAVVEGSAERALSDACLAASRGEVVVIADNRWGYKQWTGQRGAFRVLGPLELARRALDPRRPEATLAGYKRRLGAPGVVATRALALYPHALDFSLVASLDHPGPALALGPKERENRAKVLAHHLGLVPLAVPSFAVIAARSAGVPLRIERVLAELAERLGEPRPRIEHWIATRGNTSVVQTAALERDDPRGRWTLHLPHQPYQERQARRHFARLTELRRTRPRFPVPDPLFAGRLAGLPVYCERRLGDWTTAQIVGRRDLLARTYADAARQLAELVMEPARPLDEERFEVLVDAKVDLVLRHARVRSTEEWLRRTREILRERLIGEPLASVLAHADLRGKHVAIDKDGAVLGYLDWGSSEERDLPYLDLLHLVLHERKQAQRLTIGAAWRELLAEGGLLGAERAALDGYAAALGLGARVRAALELFYPVAVAAMAERNWDYSRPRWLHQSFEI
jgi:hypothetical protein